MRQDIHKQQFIANGNALNKCKLVFVGRFVLRTALNRRCFKFKVTHTPWRATRILYSLKNCIKILNCDKNIHQNTLTSINTS